jgi:hypothetical protein
MGGNENGITLSPPIQQKELKKVESQRMGKDLRANIHRA